MNVVTELNPATVLVDLETKLANAKQASADMRRRYRRYRLPPTAVMELRTKSSRP